MISTDKEFKKASIIFFNKEGKYLNENSPFDIELMAYDYVQNHEDFKYKDHVEAGVIVNCLVEFGYIEFIKRENNKRYHSITQKGLDYLKT
jgi:hypothetical protein